MIPSLEYLQRCAADTGYQISPLEKVVRLVEMASDISRHPYLGEALALKGGTALNLCYGTPRRLSVDLDYNYIAHISRERMLADRPRVEDTLTELAKRHNYRIQKSADAFAGSKMFLRYRSVMGQEERIEIDLNFLFRLPLTEIEKHEAWQPGDLDRPVIRVVGLSDLLTGKLLAFLDRCAARDAWDLAYLPEPAIRMLRSKDFRGHFIALSATLEHPLRDYTYDRLKKLLTERRITEQLLPMLSTALKPNAGKLIEKAWARSVPLLKLENHEEEYIDAVQEGILRLDLLFPGNLEEAERLFFHPAIQWKIQNVKSYQSRKKPKSNHVRKRMDRKED
ncbi:MAG: nucleotidyl transferase AbiEii/AbiGii toxin family protein [Acidobacteriota bacterium]